MSIFNYTKASKAVIGGLSSFQFLAYFRRLLFYTFVPIYMGEILNMSITEVTLLATVGMIVSAISQSTIWGQLLDRTHASRGFVYLGEITAGIGHIIMFLIHRKVLGEGDKIIAGWVIIIALAFIELPWSASNVGFSALVAEITTPDERTRLMSQLSVIGGIGGVVGATIGGVLYNNGLGFSEGAIFYFAAIIMIISGIIVLFTMKTPELKEGEEKPEIVKVPLNQIPRKIRSAYVVFLLSVLCISWGLNSVTLISNLYLVNEDTFAADSSQVGLYQNIWSISSMIMGIILGKKAFLNKFSDINILLSGAIMGATSLIWLQFAPTIELAYISSALNGATFVIILSTSYSIIARFIAEQYRGRLFGFYNAVFFLSWGSGTFIGGPISDFMIGRGFSKAEGYRMSFNFSAGLLLIGFFVLLYFQKIYNALPSHLLPENDENEERDQ